VGRAEPRQSDAAPEALDQPAAERDGVPDVRRAVPAGVDELLRESPQVAAETEAAGDGEDEVGLLAGLRIGRPRAGEAQRVQERSGGAAAGG